MKFNVGDIVARKSYGCDLLFRIKSIEDNYAIIIGEDMRLIADAPLADLLIINERELKLRQLEEVKKAESSYRLFRQDRRLVKQRNEYDMSGGYSDKSTTYFELPGRILHIDGDPLYLKKCIDLYEKLAVPIYGVHIEEKEIPLQITSLLEMVKPDILVITGHDAYMRNKGEQNEVKAYRNTKYFAEAVREARKFEPHIDHLVIFAGACQSYFETLIRAGANFASSPDRINIHALDPVYIAAKVSLTPFMEAVSVWDLLKNTLSGEKGLGGIETKGLLRRGMPTTNKDILYMERSKEK